MSDSKSEAAENLRRIYDATMAPSVNPQDKPDDEKIMDDIDRTVGAMMSIHRKLISSGWSREGAETAAIMLVRGNQ